MIELVDFTKCYSSKDTQNPTVEKINLCAQTGITGLLGLNGAGKTTIIKAIMALHYATSGKVLVSDGQNNVFDATKNPEKVKFVTGYVPENSLLPENLYVSEYLHFVQNIYAPNAYNEDKKTVFEKTISDWELESVLEKKIGVLSKGFKQRVAFAQAFIHNPENIVLDEPVNGLDPAQIIQFRKIVLEAGKIKTVLISTHLMQEVHSLCDKIYIISGGKVASYGTEDEIINSTGCANIEESFLKITNEGRGTVSTRGQEN